MCACAVVALLVPIMLRAKKALLYRPQHRSPTAAQTHNSYTCALAKVLVKRCPDVFLLLAEQGRHENMESLGSPTS